MNPVEEFLLEKNAGVAGVARRAGQLVSGSAVRAHTDEAKRLGGLATYFAQSGLPSLSKATQQAATKSISKARDEKVRVGLTRAGLATAAAAIGARMAGGKAQQGEKQDKVASPVDEFLAEFGTKEAFDYRGAAQGVGQAIGAGVTAATAGAVIGGVAAAANQAYTAMTKARDFKAMLAFAPELVDQHAENPARFNQMYSSLRAANPHFGSDPVIASTLMRRMMDTPENAGGVLMENAFRMRGEGGKPTGNDNPITRFRDVAVGKATRSSR